MKKQTRRITLIVLILLLACVTANSQVKKDISGSYDVRGTGADEAGTPYNGEWVDEYRTGSGPGSPRGQPAWGGGCDRSSTQFSDK